MKEGRSATRRVRLERREGTPPLTISFSGEVSHGYLNDMRMHAGISVSLRAEDILMNGRVGQGYGLPVDGNSQRE